MLDRSEIFRKAWADYRRDEFKGWGVRRGEPFNRKHFAYCLRMAWAVAKDRAAKAEAPAPSPKPTKALTPSAAARAGEIRSELEWLQYADRLDWGAYRELSAELARLAA